MKTVRHYVPIFWIALTSASAAFAQDQSPPVPNDSSKQTADRQMTRRYEVLEQLLSGSKLVGQYTIVGKKQESLPREEYTILSAKKMDQEDWWLLNTRIKYADKDVTLPIAIRIKWAEDTPVISLTDLTIPGLGTFSSRVVIHDNKYAGTWTHGEVGGHLFGMIERAAPQAAGDR